MLRYFIQFSSILSYIAENCCAVGKVTVLPSDGGLQFRFPTLPPLLNSSDTYDSKPEGRILLPQLVDDLDFLKKQILITNSQLVASYKVTVFAH